MARPIVLVFQELAQSQSTPTVPDLNCLVIGPAYQIEDYPDNKVDLEVSDYGTKNADNVYTPPVSATVAIALAAPPVIKPGAWVDPASVKVFFDSVRVIMASGTDAVTNTTAPNENRISSASATFVTNGVAAGDVLIIDNPVGSATPNLVLTVLSVDSETTLRVTTNFLGIHASLNYRVERNLSNQQIDSSFISLPTFRASNEVDILGGVTLPVASVDRVVAYAKVYVAYTAYRTDLENIDLVNDETDITTKIGPIDARNPLAGAVFVAKQNSGNAPIYFYGVDSNDLLGYTAAKDAISSDNSVYAEVICTADLSVDAMFKADNVALADPDSALTNGIPQKFRVVLGSGTLPVSSDIVSEVTTGTTEALAGAVPPGIKTITLNSLSALASNVKPGDQLVLTASSNVAPLDGTYNISHINSAHVLEVDTAFPVAVGAPEGINYRIFRPSTGVNIVGPVENRAHLVHTNTTIFAKVAGITAGARTIAFVQDATVPNGIHSVVEVANVSTIVNADFTSTNITSAMVVAALNNGSGVTVPFTGSINVVATTSNGATAQTALGAAALSSGVAGVNDLTSAAVLDTVYIRLFDAAATFITAGVEAGDLIEIPQNPNGVFTALGTKKFVVNGVVSEQRLEVLDLAAGVYLNNTSTTENELPHLDNRLGTGTTVSQGSIRYKVVRNLSTAQQITELITDAQSINSKRAVLAWPDVCTVAGLVDNSKPKNIDGTSAAADPQPGFYLSAVIGGMTAGMPSHQGFSRMGIAGVSAVKHSSDYFTEAQLTQLSDGGWYVFKQDSPSAIPYSIHQLTTDPSTLASGEYSVVKNLDFVSIFFIDVLEPFLGVWNINNDTLGFIRQALNTGIDNLKLRRVARIGAPLNDATITSVAVPDGFEDRIDIVMSVSIPKPLNVIGLHLVA